LDCDGREALAPGVEFLKRGQRATAFARSRLVKYKPAAFPQCYGVRRYPANNTNPAAGEKSASHLQLDRLQLGNSGRVADFSYLRLTLGV
jgi:hypothetical protein